MESIALAHQTEDPEGSSAFKPFKALRFLWKTNGLSIVLLAIFAVTLAGHVRFGYLMHNKELSAHAQPPVSLAAYVTSGHFLESLFENWESEFLQMGMYVMLTVFLHQRGSAESKKLYKKEAVDEDPLRHRHRDGVPWPVKRRGLALALYSCSLTIALFALFAVSFIFHAVAGLRNYNAGQLLHKEAPIGGAAYLATEQFWFESFQNWQSEFLSIAALVILSIYLRQKGSPESKPVFFSHSQTGKE